MFSSSRPSRPRKVKHELYELHAFDSPLRSSSRSAQFCARLPPWGRKPSWLELYEIVRLGPNDCRAPLRGQIELLQSSREPGPRSTERHVKTAAVDGHDGEARGVATTMRGEINRRRAGPRKKPNAWGHGLIDCFSIAGLLAASNPPFSGSSRGDAIVRAWFRNGHQGSVAGCTCDDPSIPRSDLI
jgi:hypothetical protein